MPKKLENPAARRINCNYSLDGRCVDMLHENAEIEGLKTSRYLEHILKAHFGIIDWYELLTKDEINTFMACAKCKVFMQRVDKDVWVCTICKSIFPVYRIN